MIFPLQLKHPMIFYQEQVENYGEWKQIDNLEIKIPCSWDLDGKISDSINYTISTGIEEEEISSLIVEHSTDLHYSSKFSQFTKEPYSLEIPKNINTNNYKYIFLKRYTENQTILLDIIGFSILERELDRLLGKVLQQLLFESRYSQFGIEKQVEDALDKIFYGILKRLIRHIGRQANEIYETMYELTQRVIHQKSLLIDFKEIQAITYRTIISQGLFPFHCEINTMNDSYLKLKLMSLFTNSEILPWSPKYHASLVFIALGNFHYSFTPNDLFNLRTLDIRKFHKGYQYMRLRILDFYPLDQWVETISNFFIDNLECIWRFIAKHISGGKLEQSAKSQLSRRESRSNSNILDLKEPFLREEQKELELMYDSRKSSRTSFSRSLVLDGSIIQTETFKTLLKRSLRQVTKTSEIYGLTIKTSILVQLRRQIAQEFYMNYGSELNRNRILNHFCAIITETELRSYSTCANNCQTPVAAFIYLLCDTFRPYSEVLYQKQEYFGYCKYSSQRSIHNQIQPAVLNKCLDYFGFFSDELSCQFLKRIQQINGNPYDFQSECQKTFEDIWQQKLQPQPAQLPIHFLMQYYQNMINRMKQDEERNAQKRHEIQDLFDEASYIYFNSIRSQVILKQRKNTLSLIGFVVIKDIDQLNKGEPENIQLSKKM